MNIKANNNETANEDFIYDVIISGAGPVGLFLACELGLAKCTVLVLEKAKDPHSPLKQLPFGIRGLSAPTIEALYRRDLLKEFELHKRMKNPHAAPVSVQSPVPPRQGGHFAGIPFSLANVDISQWPYRLPSSTQTNLLSEMAEVETILARRAESLGVDIRRGLAISGFNQDRDGVTVYSGDKFFKSKWLVGCDGSRSVVRKAGGFEFAGTEPEFTGYSAGIDIADPEKLSPGRILTSKGMYWQSQPGYLVMLEFDGGAGHNPVNPVTREQVQEVLRRVSGTDVHISSMRNITTWTDRARQSASYQNERVLLAGDAAHIHSPLGGQGLNLGIGDAMNLGWKLAATIKNNAPQSLLDSYYRERYPVGAQVLDWSRAQVAIMKPTPEAKALNAIVRDLINTRDGATYIAGRIWGIPTKYDVAGGHPLVGQSVPNFEFETGGTIGELMYNGRGILVDFRDDDSLKMLAEEYPGRVSYVRGRAKDELGLSAILIRPDGIIAWAAEDDPRFSELEEAAAEWFGL